MGLRPKKIDYDTCIQAYREVCERFGNARDVVPGRIAMLGWDLEYVCGAALACFIDQLLVRRLNDFFPDNHSPRILDCGANIGISVLNYKRQFPDARITAFEPDPLFSPVLLRNLERNHAADVQVVQAAVWTRQGQSQWIVEGVDGSRLADTLETGGRIATVQTIDLAEYLTEDIDLLKMDIEGAEYEVLRHLESKLERIKNISVECHVSQNTIGRMGALLNLLKGAGFQVGINPMGGWCDLIRQPEVAPGHWEQYFVVSAWREPVPAEAVPDQILPYIGVQFAQLTPYPTTILARKLLRLEDAIRSSMGNLVNFIRNR